jgi:hypothetical protein
MRVSDRWVWPSGFALRRAGAWSRRGILYTDVGPGGGFCTQMSDPADVGCLSFLVVCSIWLFLLRLSAAVFF